MRLAILYFPSAHMFSRWLLFGLAFLVVGAKAQEAGSVPEMNSNHELASPPQGVITFTFANPQLQPAKYIITLRRDGTGHFVSYAGSAPQEDIASLPAEGQEQEIRVTDAARERLFSAAQAEHLFATKCDTGGPKVAFQGAKTLAYDGPEGRGACSYNYSSDAKIQWVTAEFGGLAAALEEGRRLKLEHEHARLTLDAELETLTTMVKNEQATEIQNLEPVLSAILGDDNVMLRARRRAQALLDASAAPVAK